MNTLYPLKFKPIYKDKIWGGQKIRTVLGMDFSPLPNCGEVWVLSGYEGSQSIVDNGFLAGNELNELVEVYMDDLVGGNAFERFGNEFPILIKFINSNDYLSVQVHPDDEIAALRHDSQGKNEMWYIVQADEGSELISGFNRKIDRDVFVRYLKEKNLKKILNVEKVLKGDVFFIPTGRIHSLGPGILLTEIQQTSDLTYRVYDWDRVDEKGKSRELHIVQALDAMDYNFYKDYKTSYVKQLNRTVQLVKSPWFSTNLLHIDRPIGKDFNAIDSFVIYLCIKGDVNIHYTGGMENLKMGETVLIPAAIASEITLFPRIESKLIEVYIEQ
ncbi:MAG: mannose-6-phosphate isomerase [Bacteroidetes bacterium]|nr:mannose-6-phosphate isomerase [Bacteroidota bacterium]